MPKKIYTSDLSIKNKKPTEKPYRLLIGENVYCEVLPSGKKVWRMRFTDPVTGKPAIYTFGQFMADTNSKLHISLAQVRRLADDAKYLISCGIHPLREKERIRKEQKASIQNDFEKIARLWWETKYHEWEPKNAKKILQGLENDVFPVIGKYSINDLTGPDLLKMLRKIEKRGALDYMHRTKQRCSLIFSFAIGEGIAESNPVPDIKSNLKKYKGDNHNYFTADQLPEFLHRLESLENTVLKIAIKLTMHTCLRTDEIRQAEWSEIDYKAGLWRVPADRMKMGNEHWIPLSYQVVELLHELEHYRLGKYLFSLRSATQPMGGHSMLNALYDLGYRGIATIHGLRATFSTIANDAGYQGDYIEAVLAHKIGGVRGAYNHSVYLEQRRDLMQWYSDKLDSFVSR